jgi:tRNA-Thr(GGU) m(6)t(6)A37 methyltransferase TsaA
MNTRGELRFIGVVEKAGEQEAKLRVFSEFCAGLKGIENFSHAIILYWFHLRDKKEERCTLQVIPKRHPGALQVGVFASRSPSRPNPIGLCVVELLKFEECVLTVKSLDAIENSPIIDIKPYIPRADAIYDSRTPEWTLSGPPT